MSPWYLPTCVSGQSPVTSPIAHSRSPARSARRPGSRAHRARCRRSPARSRRRAGAGRWRRAGGRRAARARRRARGRSRRRRAARAVARDAQGELDAVAAQHLAERLAQRRGLARRARARPRSTRTTSPPSRRTAWAISTPTGPPPRISRRRGTAFIAGHLAVRPDPVELAQPRHRRDDRIGAVREHDVVGGVRRAVDLHHAGPGQPAAAAQQRRCPAPPASAPAPRRSSRRP